MKNIGIVLLILAALLASVLAFRNTTPKPQPNPYKRTIAAIAERYNRPIVEVESIVNVAVEESKKRDIPPTLTLAIIATESEFNPQAYNRSTASGLMQVLTSIHKPTIKRYGNDVFDPIVNIQAGLDILTYFFNIKQNDVAAISGYGGDSSYRYYYKVANNREWLQSTVDL